MRAAGQRMRPGVNQCCNHHGQLDPPPLVLLGLLAFFAGGLIAFT
jgi:hypothetical protein